MFAAGTKIVIEHKRNVDGSTTITAACLLFPDGQKVPLPFVLQSLVVPAPAPTPARKREVARDAYREASEDNRFDSILTL
jgi:hypothetical protein